MSDDRLLNPVGEAALIGAMMQDNTVIQNWAGRLTAEDFGVPVHGRIFTAMLRFVANGKPANAVTLRPVFQTDRDADYGEMLDRLVESPVLALGADGFADQVIDLAARRIAREAMHDGMEALATEFDKPLAEILGQAEEAVWAAEHRNQQVEMIDLSDLVEMVEDRDDAINADPSSRGMTNALVNDIELALGEPEGGTLIVLAGRPGMGKTAVATSASIGWAMNGHPGILFLLEGQGPKHAGRVTADLSLAMRTPIKHARMKKGGLSQEERRILSSLKERVAHLPLKIVPMKAGTDIREIWARVARHQAMMAARGTPLQFVVIDQLSLCGAKSADGRDIEKGNQRMSHVSRVNRIMTDELCVVTVALAQIGRGVEQRMSKRPTASDLKESGSLEEDCDAALLLFREEVYHREDEPKRDATDAKTGKSLWDEWDLNLRTMEGKIDFIIGKSRYTQGRTRTARYHGDYFAVRSTSVDLHEDQETLFGEGLSQ